MKQRQERVTIAAAREKFTDITERTRQFVAAAGVTNGLLTLFIQHTSASLLIQENADPDVLKDLTDAFARLAPRTANYRHATEGPDDMPSHIRAALTQTSLSIPVADGKPLLGTWQAIYLFEHRDAPDRWHVQMHIIGE